MSLLSEVPTAFVVNPEGIQPWQDYASMRHSMFLDVLDETIPEEAAVLHQGNKPVIQFPAGTNASQARDLLKRTKLGIKCYQIGSDSPDEYFSTRGDSEASDFENSAV